LFALNILAGIHFLKKYALYFPPVLSYMLHYIICVGINIKGRPVFIDGGWCGVEQLKKTPSFSEKCEKNHVGGARGEPWGKKLSFLLSMSYFDVKQILTQVSPTQNIHAQPKMEEKNLTP